MDQFCGTLNTTYRRCVCSSKLSEIQSRENALTQASDQLSDFKNLNLYVIDKSAAEVQAITTATIGEYTQSISDDKSAGASQLAGIRDVLSRTKNKSLSTQGTLDIAGDINAIWATSQLAGGTNIANLTGEPLYNAVHAQCVQATIDKCPDKSIQTMVVSAYGMYIENDCSLLINSLDKKLANANSAIRDTEHSMNQARLENYNAHNSTSINDCIAQVRADITADTACGNDYVHCLDITGRYLNIETGEPIYSPSFYQLESQISLAGDILTNETNRLLVATLNNKREFATRGLDTCRDLSDDVWNEFLRQAITEIYQGQQERIRTVKNECLDVVNNCYDEQTKSLKDFSNTKDQLLLGSRLELSEQLCREKLDACSNLYGGGPHGMTELITAMHNITDQKIAKSCLTTLQDYANNLCAVPGHDNIHSSPFACRIYAPGEQIYASIHECNLKTQNYRNNSSPTIEIPLAVTPDSSAAYSCPEIRIYNSCAAGYYMTYNGVYNVTPQAGNTCSPCPDKFTCSGGTAAPEIAENMCGDDYVGSLYHKLARYAMQTCVRPSQSNAPLPPTVLQDISVVMKNIHAKMTDELSAECERLGGIWIDTIWIDTKFDTSQTCVPGQNCEDMPTTDGIHDITQDKLLKKFYTETSAHHKWGYCSDPGTDTPDALFPDVPDAPSDLQTQ